MPDAPVPDEVLHLIVEGFSVEVNRDEHGWMRPTAFRAGPNPGHAFDPRALAAEVLALRDALRFYERCARQPNGNDDAEALLADGGARARALLPEHAPPP